MAIGIPENSIDRIFDFIDEIWDAVALIILTLIEVIWNLMVVIFVELSIYLGFSLVLCAWLFMFYTKFIEVR